MDFKEDYELFIRHGKHRHTGLPVIVPKTGAAILGTGNADFFKALLDTLQFTGNRENDIANVIAFNRLGEKEPVEISQKSITLTQDPRYLPTTSTAVEASPILDLLLDHLHYKLDPLKNGFGAAPLLPYHKIAIIGMLGTLPKSENFKVEIDPQPATHNICFR